MHAVARSQAGEVGAASAPPEGDGNDGWKAAAAAVVVKLLPLCVV